VYDIEVPNLVQEEVIRKPHRRIDERDKVLEVLATTRSKKSTNMGHPQGKERRISIRKQRKRGKIRKNLIRKRKMTLMMGLMTGMTQSTTYLTFIQKLNSTCRKKC
jgi:hypothetical protein